MPKQHRDEFENLKEWQDHQYNPGYWVNRIPFAYPPKRSKGIFLTYLIQAALIIPAFIIFLAAYLLDGNQTVFLVMMLFTGVFSVILILLLIRYRPLPEGKIKTQAERDEIRRKENLEKKKDLPKRRKDYK
jgi:hypothetical protein